VLFAAIGIALLYGSIEITTLQYRLYPPFGPITEALMPLGAYLLFTGIFTLQQMWLKMLSFVGTSPRLQRMS